MNEYNLTKNIINYYTKNVYGVPKHYIIDKNVSGAFYSLTGRITMDTRHIKALQSLGFTLGEVIQPK